MCYALRLLVEFWVVMRSYLDREEECRDCTPLRRLIWHAPCHYVGGPNHTLQLLVEQLCCTRQFCGLPEVGSVLWFSISIPCAGWRSIILHARLGIIVMRPNVIIIEYQMNTL